ncbi:MAG: quinone-dependent dihydroorotate dehydrogenase [Ferruginibacter sp.]
MYKILRGILFLFNPEQVHYFSMNGLRLLCKVGFIKKMISTYYRPNGNSQHARFNLAYRQAGIQFSNKVGLGAGFDKNAKYLNELEALGFGFVEIGTVTPLPQYGNEKPRLFRLPKDKALINRMGFNNDGVNVVVERLKKWQLAIGNRKTQASDSRFTIADSRLIIGGNIGKNKATPNDDAWKDYEICFIALHGHVDYFVVNVSSPNTAGLRELQEKDSLSKILRNLQSINVNKENPKPILLKIAPDLTKEQIDDVIDLAMEIKLDGLIVSNTTISRGGLQTTSHELTKIGAGGLSGLPVKERSTEMIQYISSKTKKKLFIIGSGGIFTGPDAKEKIDAGASLVQVWTGFIYEGPGIVKNISAYLAGE